MWRCLTELYRNRTTNVDNLDKRLALKLTMAFMVPIFTAHTLIRCLWTSFLTNFIQVECKIQNMWEGGGVISLSHYTVSPAVLYRISPKPVKKYDSHVCKLNTVLLPLRCLWRITMMNFTKVRQTIIRGHWVSVGQTDRQRDGRTDVVHTQGVLFHFVKNAYLK
jgi:hypothetical protein